MWTQCPKQPKSNRKYNYLDKYYHYDLDDPNSRKAQTDKNSQKAIPSQPRFDTKYIARQEKIAELALKLVFSKDAKKEHNGDLEQIKTVKMEPIQIAKHARNRILAFSRKELACVTHTKTARTSILL